MQSPCSGAPAIATTMGLTERAHLDGGFESASSWDEIAPGVRMSVGFAGERDAGPLASALAETLPKLLGDLALIG